MAKQEKVIKLMAIELAGIDGYEWGILAGNLKSIYLQNASVIVRKLHLVIDKGLTTEG